MIISNNLAASAASPEVSPTARSWYALRVRANFEVTVLRQIEGLGWEGFLPQYGVRRATGESQRPLFPGYVFSRFDLTDQDRMVRVRGLVHIVSSAGRPEAIPEAEIETVRRVLESGLMASPYPKLAKGQRVVIEAGPLAGLEGVILRIKNRYQVVASISILQRSVVAEIDAQWLRPIRPARRAEWIAAAGAVAVPA